ncbi:unnamed protein product, partial [Mesorhabditis belari]|uniref:Uncharacterized protein n=1 Tax=Mesorhabditis belari TaxID=2138241 RepID=A0AAF3ECR8_9BILA
MSTAWRVLLALFFILLAVEARFLIMDEDGVSLRTLSMLTQPRRSYSLASYLDKRVANPPTKCLWKLCPGK